MSYEYQKYLGVLILGELNILCWARFIEIIFIHEDHNKIYTRISLQKIVSNDVFHVALYICRWCSWWK